MSDPAIETLFEEDRRYPPPQEFAEQANAKADDVRMAGAATHAEENASAQPADRIAVELK